ncbi:unnamed protein product [Heligmosomoides polygyrus]|uniref:Uncharacterized protein n=1 Tax=Heligmosomoides polygyrus TaxID=6339 RepID=A0A3P7Y464_HELPZ|nr:unnamed protein product [Heligmosomoides polygyrus]
MDRNVGKEVPLLPVKSQDDVDLCNYVEMSGDVGVSLGHSTMPLDVSVEKKYEHQSKDMKDFFALEWDKRCYFSDGKRQVCKEVDDSEEILRKKIAELERRIASHKETSSRSRTSTSTVPSPVDALPGSSGVDEVFDASHTIRTDSFSCDMDKECSAPISLKPSKMSVSAGGGLGFEESAAAPPVTPLSHCEETSTLETCSCPWGRAETI